MGRARYVVRGPHGDRRDDSNSGPNPYRWSVWDLEEDAVAYRLPTREEARAYAAEANAGGWEDRTPM